jgi:Ca2+-dependent lipid-binding protein
MGKLMVYLDKVTNLVDKDTLGKSDPYVKLELEQDNWVMDKDFGTKTSSKKKDDLNPEWGETFCFEELPGLNNLVLKVTIKDDDPLFDDKLGGCKINLEELGLTSEPTGVDRVVDANLICKDARIFLQISYEE